VKRAVVMGAVVVILIVVNAWRWAFYGDELSGSSVQEKDVGFDANDFVIKSNVVNAKSSLTRDLFSRKIVEKQQINVVKKQPAPARKTQSEIESDQARFEMEQLKVVAIAFRNAQRYAMIASGDQLYTVYEGDRVGDRFVVEAIEVNAVTVKDSTTNTAGNISVSGE